MSFGIVAKFFVLEVLFPEGNGLYYMSLSGSGSCVYKRNWQDQRYFRRWTFTQDRAEARNLSSLAIGLVFSCITYVICKPIMFNAIHILSSHYID